jgi:hypothetical protein
MREFVRAVMMSDDIDEDNKKTGEKHEQTREEDEQTRGEDEQTRGEDEQTRGEDEESDGGFVKPGSMYFNGELLFDAFFSSLFRGHDQKREKWEIHEDKMVLSGSMEGDWVFFNSPTGYVSLADSRALPTDCICVLLGAPVPVILRRQENHYVHGFMYGEAIEMMRRGDLEVQTINIY